MVRCTAKVMWALVIGIIILNATLLFKYHSMLEEATSATADHRNILNSNNNNHHLNYPPRLASKNSSSPDDDGTGDRGDSNKYRGPFINDHFAIPDISKDAKSPWGRLLFERGIFIVPRGTTSRSSSSTSVSSSQQQNNIFDEEKYDAADLLSARILPLRLWRLDPLVPEAATVSKAAIRKQDTIYRAALHNVKRQSSILRFRWPWQLSDTNRKAQKAWVDSAPAREEVFKRISALALMSNSGGGGGGGGTSNNILRGGGGLMMKKAMMMSNNNNKGNEEQQMMMIHDALYSGEIFSDQVAQEVESVLATNHRLPIFARRMLSSRLRARKIYQSTGCNVLRIPFTSPTEDEKCVAYLSDLKNWKRLKPLPARYDARTIKFQVEFSEPDLHSVIKVSQRLFPFEAFAEIGAYHADRILGVRRITPTAYVCIPKSMIREAVKRDGSKIEADEETLKESGVKTYEEWVEKDLLQFSVRSQYNVDDHGDCVGASIQPLFADVHHLLDSALAVPYKTHDKSWHAFFNLSSVESVGGSSSPGDGGGGDHDHRRHHHHHHQNDDDNKKEVADHSNNKKSSSSSSSAPVGPYGEQVKPEDLPLRFLSAPYVSSVLHMAEVVAFDFIVGNNDRSPNKNAFVVGSCVDDFSVCTEDETSFFTVKRNREDENRIEAVAAAGGGGDGGGGGEEEKKSVEQVVKIDWREDKSALRRAGVPTFIHIDQGMAFYQTPTDNALTKSLKAKDKFGFCVFRRRFINRILDLFGAERDTLPNGDPEPLVRMFRRIATEDSSDYSDERRRNGFAKLMESSVPPKAMHAAVLTRKTFADCERRMRKVLLQLSRCLSVLPVEQVIAP